MKSHIRLVIFDLDGTLIDAYKAIEASLNFTLRYLGLPRQKTLAIRRAVGWGDTRLVLPFVGEKNIDAAMRIYRRHHRKSLLTKSKCIPGARSLLTYLKKKGYRLAVASNRPTKFSLILLKTLAIKKYFDYYLCADKLKRPKPRPDILLAIMRRLRVSKKETIYVGDMTVDVQAGRAAGVATVAVTGGSSSRGELRRERPAYLLNNVSLLKKIL